MQDKSYSTIKAYFNLKSNKDTYLKYSEILHKLQLWDISLIGCTRKGYLKISYFTKEKDENNEFSCFWNRIVLPIEEFNF